MVRYFILAHFPKRKLAHFPKRELGKPHKFKQKDEVACMTIAMRTKFCVATCQWQTLHTTGWPTRS